jgi:S1-C subfamily serine protease
MSNGRWARRFRISVGLVVALALAGCSSSSGTQSPAASASTTAPSASSGNALQDVERSTVFITVEGRFTDQEGTAIRDYVGSGFIVGADGTVVTNNHVVTGASIIKVYVAGEDQPRDARVLGVSECDDIAVLRISGASGLPALTWSTDRAQTGMDVWAAGHPDGDVQFNLSQGIVSKAPGPAATSWASVQMEIQHSAQIRGGSSGGPLVDRQGRVVGVNYAAPTAGTAGINYAIASAEVQAIVTELTTGQDITSIGLNGEALEDGSGIWVLSVKPGSPLDKAGVQAGDTITSFGGVDAAGDGTMSKYCSVLRSAQPSATIDIEVSRGDGQTLVGQVNGRELAVAHGPADSAQGSLEPSSGPVSADAAELLTHVPSEFSDTCAPDELLQDVTASLKCGPSSGADVVWYDLYPDEATMFSTYEAHRTNRELQDQGDCTTGPAEDGYTLTIAGEKLSGEHWRYLCYLADDAAWIEWTDPGLKVLSYAYRADQDWGGLYTFWSDIAGPIH